MQHIEVKMRNADTMGVNECYEQVGSCHERSNRNIAWHHIFPINKTGIVSLSESLSERLSESLELPTPH
jgi:hypothetical protein